MQSLLAGLELTQTDQLLHASLLARHQEAATGYQAPLQVAWCVCRMLPGSNKVHCCGVGSVRGRNL